MPQCAQVLLLFLYRIEISFYYLGRAKLGPCGSDKSYCVVHDFIIFSFMFVVMSFP